MTANAIRAATFTGPITCALRLASVQALASTTTIAIGLVARCTRAPVPATDGRSAAACSLLSFPTPGANPAKRYTAVGAPAASPDFTTNTDGTIDVTVIGTDSLLDSGLAIATGVTATGHTTADAKSVAGLHARMRWINAPVIDGIAKLITGAAPATTPRVRATTGRAVVAAATEAATKAAIYEPDPTTDVAR